MSALALLSVGLLAQDDEPFCQGDPGEAALMERVATAEGFHTAGTLPARLHNPGALRYAGQRGARSGPQRYARFASDWAGWIAFQRDLAAKRRLRIPLNRAWKYLKENE